MAAFDVFVAVFDVACTAFDVVGVSRVALDDFGAFKLVDTAFDVVGDACVAVPFAAFVFARDDVRAAFKVICAAFEVAALVFAIFGVDFDVACTALDGVAKIFDVVYFCFEQTVAPAKDDSIYYLGYEQTDHVEKIFFFESLLLNVNLANTRQIQVLSHSLLHSPRLISSLMHILEMSLSEWLEALTIN